MQDATANDPNNELHYSLCTKNQKIKDAKKKKIWKHDSIKI